MQVVMYDLLDTWGRDGLIAHVKKMQTDYKNRAAIVQEAAGLFLICHICCTDLAFNFIKRNTCRVYAQERMLCIIKFIACCDACIQVVCQKR